MNWIVLFLVAILSASDGAIQPTHFQHHNYNQLTSFMKQQAARCPSIMRLYDIGKSLQGRTLWVMEISDHPGNHEAGEPEMKYVGNMHGNEVTGREILLLLIEYFCSNYNIDSRVTRLINSVRMHIMPTMNPDGWEKAVEGDWSGTTGRYNSRGVDLNRDFPTLHDIVIRQGRYYFDYKARQQETTLVMNWMNAYPFVLSANFHGGALVASYPLDDTLSGQSVYSTTPDDDVFRSLAKTYSYAHPTMWKGQSCSRNSRSHQNKSFSNGITNGAAWYAISGGMQDVNYLTTNCFEITIETGCQKYPYGTSLQKEWLNHKNALLKYIEQIHRGIKGFILNSSNQGIYGASLVIQGRNKIIYATEYGDYWRLLLPGTYKATVSYPGYISVTKTVTVTSGATKQVNFTLSRQVYPTGQ
ncbi:Carboxypeptidase D [Trichoplax sp. H2]|uniref:Peptidase M14 domain-containing protein n=1 Tax=Trichoplax adhaerens TaxID=10228 RepID=B3SC48_TRIAD|nr:hypothetical protein TRIADDRAFT_33120 [Trichoplax adhaerens]EDV19678.1 hypothetical protein TRIADDRAFT_33120 [Trichoplax adhaerens]RDD38436.1 Carboxypeptidase D [Trichoplax sp. H2]|eukprot:XP_002117835.1 hypothetical protein TRIADDRAFT_33120 [Trichoplax adhaerens]